MEASPYWFQHHQKKFLNYSDTAFGPGTALINAVSALTEFGTSLVASKFLTKSDLQLSLKSLAAPNSFKRYRKMVLLSAAFSRNPPKRPLFCKKYQFGRSFTDDVVALYVLWKYGEKWSLDNYVDAVPRNMMSLDMGFFEKINANNLNFLDVNLKRGLLDAMLGYGLEKADDHDLDNLTICRDLLLNSKV